MATPPNDDTRTLFKLIADGQWHSYEEIRDQLAATVPPGRALRKYQERVEYARRYKRDDSYDTSLSEDERIFYGQRSCAQIVITSWKGKGIQYRGDSASKEIRIKPGFKTWGVEFMGPETPEEGQTQTEGPPAESEPSEPDQEGPQAPVAFDPGAPRLELPPPLAEAVAARQREESQVPEPEPDPEPEWSPFVADRPALGTCDECGSLITDPKQHSEFHLGFELRGSRSDMALFSERDMRSLLGDVMGQVIDDFQKGMQDWLTDQFQQLQAQILIAQRGSWRQRRNDGPV